MSSMFKVYRKEMEWAGKTLVLESGKVARQADASVMVSYGDTQVLCTVTASKSASSFDFFPLTVHYQERFYAAGRLPGGFFKREARPTEQETLTSRLIDRPIRPLFPENFKQETLVVCQVMSLDPNIPADVPAMIGVSAALTLSGIPFMGPIGAARVGYINEEFVINPDKDEWENSSLDLVLAGTSDGVLMVESEAQELPEEKMLEAVAKGHESFQPVIDAIIEMAENCAKDPWDLPEQDEAFIKSLKDEMQSLVGADIQAAYKMTDKQARSTALSAARDKIAEAFADRVESDADENALITSALVSGLTKKLEAGLVRSDILKNSHRIDGRGLADVRQIETEVDILTRVHGSALFTRGETQSICVVTLGTGQDEQLIDLPEGESKQSFLLHYNFPPYSVGEAGRMGPPGRREIGHGKLAWRALNPIMPSKEEFPYTIRVVSEITESNGSSSMATVCGSSMAMMAAGVPLPKPVAGIAMGLIKDGDDYAVLSDIMGDEDHLGDMDFKVAGTQDGITSLQMDIKITSITKDIMAEALTQAKGGRLHILGEMAKSIDTSNSGVNQNAPQMISMKINPDKIREVIGSGGKVIQEICAVSGAKVDIEDDGNIRIAAVDGAGAEKAQQMIEAIVTEPEEGEIYQGVVEKVVDFGAFVGFLGGSSGLVHISQIADERIETVASVLKEAQEVYVKVIGFDHRGKIKLSMKEVDQETGEPRESSKKKSKKDEEDAA